MAWLLDAPTFLFFALLSPVVALGTWLSERWSGRRSGRREAAAHAPEVAAAEARIADAVEADLRVSAAAHPDPATVATAARRRSPLLWSRGGAAGEELPVRIGDGPGDTRVTRIGGRRSPGRGRPRPTSPSWSTSAAGGGLAVTGPRERALGVLATVVGQLVTLHPPGDVDLLLLTDPRRLPDWAWARWLPHLDPRAVHVRRRDGARGGRVPARLADGTDRPTADGAATAHVGSAGRAGGPPARPADRGHPAGRAGRRHPDPGRRRRRRGPTGGRRHAAPAGRGDRRPGGAEPAGRARSHRA